MTITKERRRVRRMATHPIVIAAVLAGAVGALAGTAVAGDDEGSAVEDDRVVEVDAADAVHSSPETPVWIRVREQRRLCELVAAMPSSWPATEAMREQAEQPLGDAAERARWRRDAELLPSYWPAAQVMRASAEPRSGCPS